MLVGSQAEYARHAGISKQAVSKLVKKGSISKRRDGKIDFAEADHARKVNGDPARQMGREELGDVAALDNPEPSKEPPSESGLSYNKARTAREAYQAKIAELDYQERVGKILKRQEVEDAMVAAGRKIRQGLDGIPGWADEIDAAARNGGVAAVRALLKQRVRALETLIVESLSLLADDET